METYMNLNTLLLKLFARLFNPYNKKKASLDQNFVNN